MYKGEFFNSISHLVGATFALIGASVLITLASIEGDSLKIVSYSIYSTTLFLLYLSSTLYHSFQGRAKEIFKRCDHLAIYLLIAGTYTPFTLIAMQSSAGWWLFGIIWFLAAIGIIIENLPIKGPRIIPVVAGMTPLSFKLLIAGGVVYTVGVIFYVLDNWFKHMHAIWHLFVIGGSLCHYFAILLL